ncbi:MAG: argininosuccinate lyase [delta proteobacterium MLS_D]|jgi:argininosuccinate lyase|nr:MAG: argininosuccinate lyase [delta proteobacterium MLS_D]
MTGTKLWSGRFKEATDARVEEFTASIHFDRRLYRYDIEGSIAHATMLARQGVISDDECASIVSGLRAIQDEIEQGVFVFHPEQEDIHMAIEAALISRIGDAGEKLHTGRSRNDQIALDLRLYLRDEITGVIDRIGRLKQVLLRRAREEVDTILPGYTHLQKAQPVRLSHYLLAYREMFDRDEERLRSCFERVNVMPLGSAALAGTSIPIDRAFVAELLGFPRLSANSMDAVADRDGPAEFIFAAALTMAHLSRFCEDLILWSTDHFGFVEMADSFTTGSSIMPQKKNPDVAELLRGKTGRVYGDLISLLTVLKGLPMTYNRDLQEDKEPLFDAADTLASSLDVFEGLVATMAFRRDRMFEEASRGFATATDLAEYLVTRGIPFRRAHNIVGRLVGYCLEQGKDFSGLSLEEIRQFYSEADETVFEFFSVQASPDRRSAPGGTAKSAVLQRIKEIEEADEH